MAIQNIKHDMWNKALLTCLLFLSLKLGIVSAQNQIDTTGRYTNLGVQVSEKWLEGTVFITDDRGTEWVYTVLRGKPGYLIGYNISKRKIEVNLPLIKMDGAWDITASSDGWVYIAGSAGGRLAKHRPGSQEIIDLGRPIESESYLFAVTAGNAGEIYGATYPGCRVFRYHPDLGFVDVAKGPIVEGENYVHGIAYDKFTNKIFAGIGSHSYLVEIDVATGKKRELLPEKYVGKAGFVYDMSIVKEVRGGDRLFANLPDLQKTLVYNLKTKSIDRELDGVILTKAVARSLTNDRLVYYTDSTRLLSLDLSNPTARPIELLKTSRAMNIAWGKDRKLYFLNNDGELVVFNPETGKATFEDIGLPAQPIGINITKMGPDGRIWTGGYLVGSNAAYDPTTGKTTRYSGLHQSESITIHNGLIYFGIYPKGRFYKYDPSKEWDVKKGNPHFLGQIEAQDRPFAGAGIPGIDRVFFGVVPDYGRLGGALVEYDVAKDGLVSHGVVVDKQSIVSLVYHDNQIIGGTSVWGGLGIQPEAREAKLFGWDYKTNQKTFEIVPVQDAKAITSLFQGADGHLWGVADGELFVFDVKNKAVISKQRIFDLTPAQKSSAVWRDVTIVKHPSGDYYGTGNGKLFKINAKTKDIQIIPSRPAFFLSIDKEGNLYFRDGEEMWRYQP